MTGAGIPVVPALGAATVEVALKTALDVLAAGGVVAIPTDTVYGLAVLPAHQEAVAALFALKERPIDVALPVLVGDLEGVAEVAVLPSGPVAGLARRWWPGPLTIVLERAPGFDADLGGPPDRASTVGVRWPDHLFVAGLCRRAGPLAVTSANRHGDPPCTSADQVVVAFAPGPAPDLVVDGGTCDGVPSTVVDCSGTAPTCLREGAVPWADLEGDLGSGS